MKRGRRPWQEELEIIDRTMRSISGITNPEELVGAYWNGIGELVPIGHFVALSRRNVEPPNYLITRSSRFTEDINPFTDRDRLPKLQGGLLGEIAYANRPVIIDDLPTRLSADDPAHFYLHGFSTLIALPQYDGGQGLNITCMLVEPGRELDPEYIPMMHWHAGLFGRGTTNLVLRNQLSSALAALDQELQVVGRIQRSLLPQELPEIPGYDLAAHYMTSTRAGGDYYDFFPLPDGRWGLFIADVSGHGTPAAVIMAITHAVAHAQPGTHSPPATLLSYLNDALARSYTRDGSFITSFYGVLDPRDQTLTYSNAGHNPPRLVRSGQVLSLDDNGSLPLGIFEGEGYTQDTVKLEPGDLLLLYTDGITEASPPRVGNAERRFFGLDRLDTLLLNRQGISAEGCIYDIKAAVAAFAEGAPPADDQTLIAIRCT